MISCPAVQSLGFAAQPAGRKLWEIPELEHKASAAHPLFAVIRVRNATELKQFRFRHISLL